MGRAGGAPADALSSARAPSVREGGDAAESRYGLLSVVRSQDGPHQLRLADRTILTAEDLNGDLLSIVGAHALGDRDVFVVQATAGKACPAQHTVVEIAPNGRWTATAPFGSCSDLVGSRIRDRALLIETPRFSNVEVVSGSVVYRYVNGVVRQEGSEDAPAPAAERGSALPLELGFLREFDPEEDDGYVRRLEKGYALLAENRSAPALAEFQGAARIPLVEEANTLPWAGEAEALCRLERKAEGRAALADFSCAVELTARRRTCASLEVAELTPRGGPGFPARCHAELCAAEIVRGTLDGAPIAGNRRVSDGLTRLASRVAKQCAS